MLHFPLQAPQLSPLSGAYCLIVVGEPFSEEHKKLILQKLQQGKTHGSLVSASGHTRALVTRGRHHRPNISTKARIYPFIQNGLT